MLDYNDKIQRSNNATELTRTLKYLYLLLKVSKPQGKSTHHIFLEKLSGYNLMPSQRQKNFIILPLTFRSSID